MIETRPRSSAAACRTRPTPCAPRPISQTTLVSRPTSVPGWRKETSLRLSVAFCQSVAASAKKKAAKIARRAAISSTGAPHGSARRSVGGCTARRLSVAAVASREA